MSSINSNAGLFNAQNSSIVPLLAGDIFDGIYTSTLNYSVIEVSVKTDSIFNLTIVYSPDGVNDEFSEVIIVSTISTDTLFYKFEPKMRYFKLKLENTDVNDQSLLSLQCILKSSFIYEYNSKLTDIYNIINSKGSAQMVINTTYIPVQLPNVKSCTIYGRVSGPIVLTLKFSPNGVDFFSSQYSINMTGAGDFGFVIDGLCANWILFNGSTSANVLAFVDFC